MAAQTTSSERKNPKQATKTTKEKYPQGRPRGGEDEHPNRTDLRTTTQDIEITTTRVQCICGKSCKNQKGLKIHQGKMKCLTAAMTTQRTEVTSGQTQEEPGPDATHSAQSLLVSPTPADNSSHATLRPQESAPSPTTHRASRVSKLTLHPTIITSTEEGSSGPNPQ